MSANFNFYLNRQGAKGRKGDKGEQGYSPSISVETETAAEYVLKIQNEGYSFTTPNLRGNAIENTGGTYIRFNPETEQMYTGGLDLATTQSAGAVMLTPTGGIAIGGSTNDVPTSAEVYDYVESKITSIGEGYVTETEFDNYTAATALTLNGIAGDISTLDTSKMSFTDLVSSLVAGSNITLTTDAENKTITINAAGGDLTNYVTTNTVQTITAGKTFQFSGDNAISASPYKFRNYTSSTGDIYIGSNLQSGGIVVDGGALTLGMKSHASGTNYSHSIYLPYNNYNAYIIKAEEYYTQLDDAYVLPIFTPETLLAGSGVTITSNGTKFNKTYTINATGGDLSNYVTTNTAQTITGSKTFTTNLNLQETSPCINFKAGAGQTMGYVRFDSTGQTMRVHSNGIMYIETYQHSGTNAINVDNLVVQSDIAAKENTSNKVTSISSASTDTEYPSAKCVYDAIQSELGNITTLLNNINSGSGS